MSYPYTEVVGPSYESILLMAEAKLAANAERLKSFTSSNDLNMLSGACAAISYIRHLTYREPTLGVCTEFKELVNHIDRDLSLTGCALESENNEFVSILSAGDSFNRCNDFIAYAYTHHRPEMWTETRKKSIFHRIFPSTD